MMEAFGPEAVDGAGVIWIVIDSTGTITHCNRSALTFLAQGLDEVRGNVVWTVASVRDSADALKAAITRCLVTRQRQQVEVTWTADGKRIGLLSVSIAPGREGHLQEVTLCGMDITASLAPAPVAAAARDLVPPNAEPEQLRAALETERNQLRTMLDIVPLAILFFRPNGDLYFNRRAEELLGIDLSPRDGSAQYAQSITYPDGRPVPREELVSSRVMRNGETVIAEEFVIARSDGRRVPILGSAAPLRDSNGRVIGGVGVFQDVSERMQAERALRLSEARLSAALKSAPVILSNQDVGLRYTWAHNPVPPWSVRDVLGKTELEFLPAGDAEVVAGIKRRVIETGVGTRSVVRVNLGGDARYYDLTVDPLRDDAGGTIGVTCAGWDVTEQKRAAERQHFLAEAGTVLLGARLDVDTMMAKVGELAVRELADLCVVELRSGACVRRLVVAHGESVDPELAAQLQRMDLETGRATITSDAFSSGRSKLVSDAESDIGAVRQNDELRALLQRLGVRSWVSVPLRSRGKTYGAFALVSTRAPRRYGEQEVHFAEEFARLAALAVENAHLYRAAQRAVAARDEVLGIVAHDLRNPLNLVMLNVDLLASCDVAREPRGDSVGAIRRACDRMNRLVEDMLDIARLEGGTLAIARVPVDTTDLLDEALETQREAVMEASLTLRSQFTAKPPEVMADRDRLLQVFDNLIGNAIKFTAPGGAITIGSKSSEEEVLMWVSDTGAGMSAEQTTHVFDRFWQANRKDRRGAGLGLSIVKGIVDSLGGRIWVESQLGSGSTFYFTIPCVHAITRDVHTR